MSYQLRNQANLWWQTLANEETLNTYQKTIQITWDILQKTAKLLWLFLCLGLVVVSWLWITSKSSGQQLRIWYEGLAEPKINHAWEDAGQWLLSVGRSGADLVLGQASEQLGLQKPEPRPLAQSMASVSKTVTSSPVVTEAAQAVAKTVEQVAATAEGTAD